jgi:outer membrane protein TolC
MFIGTSGGCRTMLVDRTDRDVYGLIADRQDAALGETSNVQLDPLQDGDPSSERMYRFTPRPIDARLPDAFRTPKPAPKRDASDTSQESSNEEPAQARVLSPNIFTDSELDRVLVFGLSDVLAYAARHARDLVSAKEDLYLAALDLTLERHLWTPQFVAGATATYDDFADGSEFDRAMQTVSDVSLSQRLPFGGDVTARVIHTLTHDVRQLVEKGEDGQVILSANLPLLRGAGRSAYESRYAAERELIYAIRRFERFRRAFLVNIAGEYFSLQQSKASIDNTHVSYLNRKLDWERADFMHQVGRSRSVFEAPRAKSTFRDAEAALVSAKERYESALDRFKILIGMPVDSLLDVLSQQEDTEANALDSLLPNVAEQTAVETASRYRLDLLNSADSVDDARRGVGVAKNRVLPDLALTGSATFGSDLDQLRPVNFREERADWQGGINLAIDDRKTERNAYRAAMIAQRRAEREHDEFKDTVRADVRRALRSIAQQDNLRTIRTLSVEENERRVEAARAQYRLGKSTNQDVVDAENDLLRARNEYAAAVAAYREAILAFRRDTGTLRLSDTGQLLSQPTGP